MKFLVVYQGSAAEAGAKALAEGIEKGEHECSVKALGEVKPQDAAGYDVICVGAQVGGLSPRLPQEVSEFLEGLPSLSGKCGAVFCICSLGVGKALQQMREALEKKGAKVLTTHTARIMKPTSGFDFFVENLMRNLP
ncbi:MAG: flavodoxin family protein [bacterium]